MFCCTKCHLYVPNQTPRIPRSYLILFPQMHNHVSERNTRPSQRPQQPLPLSTTHAAIPFPLSWFVSHCSHTRGLGVWLVQQSLSQLLPTQPPERRPIETRAGSIFLTSSGPILGVLRVGSCWPLLPRVAQTTLSEQDPSTCGQRVGFGVVAWQ